MKPLVSIILIAFNAERFIKRALASALGQTYPNIEIIVVDDGSTDHTADVVRAFTDPRIRYFYQNNQGQGAARNRGIRESQGTYITFLDADDFYLPEKIEKQVNFLQTNPEYQVVYCNTLHFYSERPDIFFKRKGKYPSGDIFPDLLHEGIINPNTFMAHQCVFEAGLMFREGRYGRYAEEWDLYLRISRAGFKFGYLDEDLVVVEVREGSNTTWDIQSIMKENVMEMLEGLFVGMSESEKNILSSQQGAQKAEDQIGHCLSGE
jgi:glycosyltransferase involved in cell wall biosynthesis